MKRLMLILPIVVAFAVWSPAAAPAFNLTAFDVTFENEDGSPATQAGSHPYAMKTKVALALNPDNPIELAGELKDLNIDQIPGFVGTPGAMPRCPTAKFLERTSGTDDVREETHCPNSSAVGTVTAATTSVRFDGAVYNLVPPPGAAAKLGLVVGTVPVTIELGVNEVLPHEIVAKLTNVPQPLPFHDSTVTLWGNPASPVHDSLRGFCAKLSAGEDDVIGSRGTCSISAPEIPFLTLPRTCQGPLLTTYVADSWQGPGARFP